MLSRTAIRSLHNFSSLQERKANSYQRSAGEEQTLPAVLRACGDCAALQRAVGAVQSGGTAELKGRPQQCCRRPHSDELSAVEKWRKLTLGHLIFSLYV